MADIEIDKSAFTVAVSMVRGDDFVNDFRVGGKEDEESATEYWDLTGWTLRGQVRKKASTVVLATIEATPFDDQDADAGKFSVFIAGNEATSLGTKMFPTECIGDLEFVDPDGHPRTYFYFTFTVQPDVTRV